MKIYKPLLLLTILLSSCIGTSHLANDEYILYKQNIKTSGKVTPDNLQSQLAQQPNSRLPFFPISVGVQAYYMGQDFYDSASIVRKTKKVETKFNKKISRTKNASKKSRINSKKNQKLEHQHKKLSEGNLLMRWGEKVAVFDSSKMASSIQNISNYLFIEGYFNSKVSTEVKYTGLKAHVTYSVEESKAYKIDSLIFDMKDPKMEKIFYATLDNQALKGKRYRQSLLTDERDRVYNIMTNRGYYNFKRQYVLFEIDSTQLDDRRLIIRETIANPPGESHHQIYKLDSVIFSNESKSPRNWQEFNNVTFLLQKNKYPERVLRWRIFMEKDSLYCKDLTLETQKQLSYLDMFKFVNINYDSTGGQFIASIFTSPLKKYQTSSEVGLSMLDQAQGLPGPFFNFNAKSRNTFGGLEIIQFDASASIQGIQNVSDQQNTYSRLQYGGQFSITFPQFLFPLKDETSARIGRYNPRTKFSTGINFEDRKGEYLRTTLNGNMAYIWQVKDNSQFTMKPLDVSYINSHNFGDFADNLKELEEEGYQSLVSAFQSSLVTFSSFGFQFNTNNYGGTGNNTANLVQGYLEAGGHSQELFNPGKLLKDSLAYYQYLKVNFEYRSTVRISSKSQFAYRLNTGAAYSYGSNRAMPYEKYFFAGGSNSIRAWQPRRLGPGSYAPYASESTSDNIVVDYSREEPGDIIFESSIEYRHDLFGFTDYALFIDAGNIWLWKSQTLEKKNDGFGEDTNDDGVFKLKSFPREIAVGAGFGLRFDFSFLVLRVDLAYKIVDPAYPLGQRFILDQYKLTDLWDLQNKAALNIGIGYPF